MIKQTPKPLPHLPIHRPDPKRLPEGKSRRMTLVAGFRCQNGGVLLCADREEDNGYTKQEVDKIFRIPVTQIGECDVFLAGAGSGSLITKAQTAIFERLLEIKEARDAAQKKAQETGTPVEDVGSIFRDHRAIIENTLTVFYETYAKEIEANSLAFVIVVAPYVSNRTPMLYRTDKAMLVDVFDYCAHGSGRVLSDYFAGRLFQWDRMSRASLAILAAFILREAEYSASGVGLGNDMVFIHDGERSLRYLHKDYIKQLQDCIPSVEGPIFANWKEQVKIPEWLANL